ncbi:MAG: hypothetical protein F6K28_49410, partial [Microcoleus sp. SIO2G3]|nr:hypothetical protein [Microcoleus sp. SIO2G3]
MPRETPPSSLETAITRSTHSIERLIDRIDALDQSFDRRLDRIAEGLEAVTEQIGRLSEATYETQSLLREA